LDSSIFFATSMARMGADFQPLLLPIFQPKVISIVVGYWNEGVANLGEVLKVCRDAGIAAPLYSDASTATTTTTEDGMTSTPAPPRILLTLPPLARLLNSYLSGLNELRRCLLPQTFCELRSHLSKFCEEVESIMSLNERAVLTPGMRGDAMKLREVAKKMREVFKTVFKPFCVECLEISFGCLKEETKEEEVEHEETAERGKEGIDENNEELEDDIKTNDDEGAIVTGTIEDKEANVAETAEEEEANTAETAEEEVPSDEKVQEEDTTTFDS